jgi:hypothetical protein
VARFSKKDDVWGIKRSNVCKGGYMPLYDFDNSLYGRSFLYGPFNLPPRKSLTGPRGRPQSTHVTEAVAIRMRGGSWQAAYEKCIARFHRLKKHDKTHQTKKLRDAVQRRIESLERINSHHADPPNIKTK